MGIREHVEFVVNAPFSVLQDWYARASIGIHTMWNEHFGISIVEMMAAGLLVVAHNSGGPKMDIVTPWGGGAEVTEQHTGYLATTPAAYAACLSAAFVLCARAEGDDNNNNSSSSSSSSSSSGGGDGLVRDRARRSVARFSDEIFSQNAVELMTAQI